MLAAALRQSAQPNTHVLGNTISRLWCSVEERLACSCVVDYRQVKYVREELVATAVSSHCTCDNKGIP